MALLESVVILLTIIVIHEGGHFVAAILTGITVKGLYLGISIPDLPFLPGLVRKLFRKIQLRLRLGKYPFVVSPFLLGAMVDVDEDQLREAIARSASAGLGCSCSDRRQRVGPDS